MKKSLKKPAKKPLEKAVKKPLKTTLKKPLQKPARLFQSILSSKLRTMVAILALAILCLGIGVFAFSANATPLSECHVSLSPKTYSYTGSEVIPKLVITHDGKKLKEGDDYAVTYTNNTQPGKAKMIIAGKHAYRGFVREKYNIIVDPVKNLDAKYIGKEKINKDSFINLSWGDSPDCNYYLITAVREANDKSEPKKYKFKSDQSNFNFKDLDKNGVYKFTVTAVSGKRNVRSKSESILVRVNPLLQPKITKAESPGAGRIDVSWEKVPDAQQYIVTETSESNGDKEELTVPAEDTTAIFMGKIKGNTYKYTVKAVANLEGKEYESPASESVSASPATPKIGQATNGEHGNLRGCKAGDQSGGECSVSKWSYSSKKGSSFNWQYVARFKDPQKSILAAEAMKAACANNHIGYDQTPSNGRGELKALARDANWDMSAITQNCEASCSPLVGACICCAGVDYPPPGSTSDSDFLKPLEATGEFEILRDKKYTSSDKYLQEGDILVSPGRHTGMVL